VLSDVFTPSSEFLTFGTIEIDRNLKLRLPTPAKILVSVPETHIESVKKVDESEFRRTPVQSSDLWDSEDEQKLLICERVVKTNSEGRCCVLAFVICGQTGRAFV
jgi:hypothetical protein